jgi:hypothetical protein
MSVATRTVEFQYLDADGDPVAGYLKFTPTVTVVDSVADSFYTLSPDTVVLDETGSGSITLACTDDPELAPTGWAWAVAEFIPGGRNNDNTFFVAITSDLSDPVGLTDLAGVVPTAFGSGGFGAGSGLHDVWIDDELPQNGERVPPYLWVKFDGSQFLVLDDETTVPGTFTDIYSSTY